MLTAVEVQHIAKLARIAVKPEDEQQLSQQLTSILDYVGKLNEVETAHIEPTSQVTDLVNVTREDVCIPGSTTQHDLLLKNFPQRVQNLLKVRSVF